MTFSIRVGRESDLEAVTKFTANTFEWGDYIVEVFTSWVADGDTQVMVAVDGNDKAIALGTGFMVSPTEMWLQGVRVTETWRRMGIASEIGSELVEWGTAQGAQVARLITEGWNTAAQRQVENTGFIQRGRWIVGSRSVAPAEPTTATNGGRRATAHRKLELAHSSEAIPAWVSWRSGPLVGPSRGMFAHYWKWMQLTASWLETAAKDGALWSSQAGWATAHPHGDRLAVGWLDCGPDDADVMIRSLVDLALETRSERVQITVPEVDWLVTALERSGCELMTMIVYERPL